MGYRFQGFFVDSADAALVAAVSARWPRLRHRVVEVPFAGAGFAFPDPGMADSINAAATLLEQLEEAEDGLAAFSAGFPGVTFAWIQADCFGGTCLYSGHACRDGRVIVREPRPQPDALGRLVAAFGIDLGPRQHFVPFERAWFEA